MERGSYSSKRNLESKRAKFLITFNKILEEYNQLQNDVLENHLQWWKIDQSKNGFGDENRLICIQKLCEDLAEIILLLKQTADQINWETSLESMEKEKIAMLFRKLVSDTLMIMKQPPQVL